MFEINYDLIWKNLNDSKFQYQVLLPLGLICLYLIYLKIFKYYTEYEKVPFSQRRVNSKRGNPVPSYPNGWYRIASSWEFKRGDVKNVRICGRYVALFRGEDGIMYGLAAFCTHLGANLAEGGQVKWKRCIECPFHGWTFDGATGKCVNSDALDPKIVSQYTYHDVKKVNKHENCFLKKEVDAQESKVKKYNIIERNGLVFIWLHSKEVEPFYQIPELNFPLDTTVVGRSETLDHVNCQTQEIPENGADWKHFEYVHYYLFLCLVPWVKFAWRPISRKATDPDFWDVMTQHERPKVREFQNKLYKEMLKNKEELPYINVISLDAYLRFFDKWNLYLQTATVFQIGSASVFLFFKFPFWEMIIVQMLVPVYKFTQAVHHKLYTTWWLPYWFTTVLFKAYLKQVNSDKRVWNNKIFADKLHYNLKSEADQQLLKWRQWYSQFYDGCDEFEKTLEAYDW